MEFNFDGIEDVRRANPVRARATTWRLKRKMRAGNPVFTFSTDLFDQLDLAHNSLMQRSVPHPKAVLIAVVPGNDGVWAKTTEKGNKGKTFKNVELANALDAKGIVDENLDLISVGQNNGWDHYAVVPYGVESLDDLTDTVTLGNVDGGQPEMEVADPVAEINEEPANEQEIAELEDDL